jgi:hypothetical protein
MITAADTEVEARLAAFVVIEDAIFNILGDQLDEHLAESWNAVWRSGDYVYNAINDIVWDGVAS